MFPVNVGVILGSIAALVLTIVLYITVMPRKLDGTFQKPILQKLHDFFHFKKLYLEEVLKFFYVLATITVICIGVFMLLSYYESYSWSYYGGSHYTQESTFGYGLGLLLVGPIALRLIYEVSLMFILLVKNTIEINNKLSKTNNATEAAVVEAAVVSTVCPKCGAAHGQNDSFCTTCGQKL